VLSLHTHRLLSHVMRMGKGVMTFIERARLFESASWHFKSHQDQLFCSVLCRGFEQGDNGGGGGGCSSYFYYFINGNGKRYFL
jgi:hypothetical protein